MSNYNLHYHIHHVLSPNQEHMHDHIVSHPQAYTVAICIATILTLSEDAVASSISDDCKTSS